MPNQTTHFGFNLATGTDVWNPLVVENPAIVSIDNEMYKVQNAAFSGAEHTKTGNTHEIIETIVTCPIFYFAATADYRAGDSFTLNGAVVTARLPDGTVLDDYAFRINSNVIGILNGGILTLVTNAGENNTVPLMIAQMESSNIAQYSHSVYSYFIYNSLLYLTTVAINIGGTIVPGTNCVATTVANVLKEHADLLLLISRNQILAYNGAEAATGLSIHLQSVSLSFNSTEQTTHVTFNTPFNSSLISVFTSMTTGFTTTAAHIAIANKSSTGFDIVYSANTSFSDTVDILAIGI